jgi:hypothetical protein
MGNVVGGGTVGGTGIEWDGGIACGRRGRKGEGCCILEDGDDDDGNITVVSACVSIHNGTSQAAATLSILPFSTLSDSQELLLLQKSLRRTHYKYNRTPLMFLVLLLL